MVLLGLQRFRSSEGEKKISELVKESQTSNRVTFGIDIVDKDIVEAVFIPEDSDPIPEMLIKSLGEPDNMIRVDFPHTILKDNKVTEAPILEHIVHFFPAAQVTAQFRTKIEDDFTQFDAINARDTKRLFLETGWSLPVDNVDVAPGKCIAFVTLAGWTSMELFEQNMQRKGFEDALQILLAWKAPWKMVSLKCPLPNRVLT